MYRIMAIADYEDRFVVPSSHKEMVEDSFNEKGSCGFTFGNGCSGGVSEGSLFGRSRWAARSSSTCPSPARRPPRPEQRRT